MLANPMILPLAMYRYWAGVFFSTAKVADAAIERANLMPAAAGNGAKPAKRFARRPRYVSARVQKARQKH
jgi:hypothetical protein